MCSSLQQQARNALKTHLVDRLLQQPRRRRQTDDAGILVGRPHQRLLVPLQQAQVAVVEAEPPLGNKQRMLVSIRCAKLGRRTTYAW